jgi:hypothetical protein
VNPDPGLDCFRTGSIFAGPDNPARFARCPLARPLPGYTVGWLMPTPSEPRYLSERPFRDHLPPLDPWTGSLSMVAGIGLCKPWHILRCMSEGLYDIELEPAVEAWLDTLSDRDHAAVEAAVERLA